MLELFEERLENELKALRAKNLFRKPLAFNNNFLNLTTNDYFLLRHNKQVLAIADEIAQKIKKAKTDSDPLPDLPDKLKNRPEALNLLGIYAALSDSDLDNTCKKFSGKLFSDFKNDLADLAVSVLSPISDEMRR